MATEHLVRGASDETARGVRQLAPAGALLALAGLAWVASYLRMSGMDAGPGTDPGAFGLYISTWVLMMAAMMLPAITPVILAYSRLERVREAARDRADAGGVGLFVGGYLAVWAGAGALGYAVLEAGRSLDGAPFAWNHAGRWVAAGVLMAAALYELTQSKGACLTRCRDRSGFSLSAWQHGRRGALRVGLEHGAWCLGCCWALMAALFALGAMSIGWMALIAVLVAVERLAPWRRLAVSGIASLLAALAIGVVTVPAQVPMLTMPGGPAAMRAMGMAPAKRARMARASPTTEGMHSMPTHK